MKKHVVARTRIIGNDAWKIQFCRLNGATVKVTCCLMRPNRKFWQSKRLWRGWTYTNKITADALNDLAVDIIAEYYTAKLLKEGLNSLFQIINLLTN